MKKQKKGLLRRFRFGSVLPVILTALIGLLLVCVPETAIFGVSIAAGVLLVLTGCTLVLLCFLTRRAELLQLLFGVAAIALAIWLFADANGALSALLIAFAVLLLLRALFGMLGALGIKNAGGSWWAAQLALSVVIAVAAIVLLAAPIKSLRLMMILVGAFLLFDAVSELLSLFFRRSGTGGKEGYSEPVEVEEETVRERARREKEERRMRKKQQKKEGKDPRK